MTIKGILLDLDGTVYWGRKSVPGSARFVAKMRRLGIRCLFVTNRANRTPREISLHLKDIGIPCRDSDVLTSAEATAKYIGKGSVYCIGEKGMKRAIRQQELTLNDRNPDCVIVSFDRSFTYGKLFKACQLIHAGSKFIATNPDKGLKTDEGIYPGTGAIIAAVVSCTGVEPLVIGKPERLIVDMALDKINLAKKEVLMVGDNIETDIVAGKKAGVRTVLMLTGISKRQHVCKSRVKPTWIVENYIGLEKLVNELS